MILKINKQYHIKNLIITISIDDRLLENILSICDENYLEGISLHNNLCYYEDYVIDLCKLIKFKNLRIIKFYYCDIIRSYKIKDLDNLKEFPKLDTIFLKNCIFNDELLNILTKVKQLKILTIISSDPDVLTQINYGHIPRIIDFTILSKLLNLTKLVLSNDKLLDHHLTDFYKLEQLKELILHTCSEITNNGIENITKVKNLQSLKIYRNLNIDTNGFLLLLNLNNLHSLYLSNIRNMCVFPYIIINKKLTCNLKIFMYDFYYEKIHFNEIIIKYKTIYKLSDINFTHIPIQPIFGVKFDHNNINIKSSITIIHKEISNNLKEISIINLNNNLIEEYCSELKEYKGKYNADLIFRI